MCVQQLSPAWKGAGKLAAPPVLLLAWSCSMPGDERGPSPAGSNDPGCVQTRCPSASLGSPSPAWLPAKIWGWRPRGEAWVCAAPKRAAKVVRRSVQPETPSHDLCALGSLPGSGSPMPHIQDVMSWAVVPPEKKKKKKELTPHGLTQTKGPAAQRSTSHLAMGPVGSQYPIFWDWLLQTTFL